MTNFSVSWKEWEVEMGCIVVSVLYFLMRILMTSVYVIIEIIDLLYANIGVFFCFPFPFIVLVLFMCVSICFVCIHYRILICTL